MGRGWMDGRVGEEHRARAERGALGALRAWQIDSPGEVRSASRVHAPPLHTQTGALPLEERRKNAHKEGKPKGIGAGVIGLVSVHVDQVLCSSCHGQAATGRTQARRGGAAVSVACAAAPTAAPAAAQRASLEPPPHTPHPCAASLDDARPPERGGAVGHARVVVARQLLAGVACPAYVQDSVIPAQRRPSKPTESSPGVSPRLPPAPRAANPSPPRASGRRAPPRTPPPRTSC